MVFSSLKHHHLHHSFDNDDDDDDNDDEDEDNVDAAVHVPVLLLGYNLALSSLKMANSDTLNLPFPWTCSDLSTSFVTFALISSGHE